MDFCELLGTQPYLAANITSTTLLQIRVWMDYCNSSEGTTSFAEKRGKNGHSTSFHVNYWGIGNGTGRRGIMDPVVYAHEYRRYSALADNIPGNKFLLAC